MPRKRIPKTRTLPVRYKPGFIDRMDGREKIAQALQQAFDEIVEDIGGADGQSHLKLALVERAVFLEFKLREWEKEMLTGKLKDVEIGRWIQGVNSLNGLCKMLGFREVAKGDYLDALYSEPDPSDSDNAGKAPSTAQDKSEWDGWDDEPETKPKRIRTASRCKKKGRKSK